MDADSPFHSTQRVMRGVSGKFGRHGKIILTLDEYIKWQDGLTNWHAVFTISKKKVSQCLVKSHQTLFVHQRYTRNQSFMRASISSHKPKQNQTISAYRSCCLETSGLHFHQAIQRINHIFYVTIKAKYDFNKII